MPPCHNQPMLPAQGNGRTAAGLAAVLFGALALRLVLTAFAPSPGIADPSYYFDLAENIARGRGLTDDLIWQFHRPPADVTHPADYYPPLTALLCAGAMHLGGVSLPTALAPFALLGALALPLLAYLIGGAVGLGTGSRLFATAVVATLPELVLNSVRTDTTVVFAVLVGLSLLWLGDWLAAPAGPRPTPVLAAAGAAAGFAYLTRLDALVLPVSFLVTFVAISRAQSVGVRVRHLLCFAAPMLAVTAPWLVRNWLVLGTAFPVELGRTMFVTSVLDLFSYGGTFTLSSYLAWGPRNILGKIAFEALGNVKMAIVLLAAFAPAALAAAPLLASRPPAERRRLLVLAPAGVFFIGVFAYYTVFAPFLSQSVSFKKAAIAVLPFVVVAGVRALESVVQSPRARFALGASVVAIVLFQALDLVRSDFRRVAAYEAMLAPTRAAVSALGDANGDGRTVVMTQDPFAWASHGVPAVMLPNDDRNTIFAVAARYAVDYLVFPADRQALDPVQLGEEDDPRLRLAWEHRPTGMALYRPLPRPTPAFATRPSQRSVEPHDAGPNPR